MLRLCCELELEGRLLLLWLLLARVVLVGLPADCGLLLDVVGLLLLVVSIALVLRRHHLTQRTDNTGIA